METITYGSEVEGITEKPATNPETGLTDAQAVRKLLDAHIALQAHYINRKSESDAFYETFMERIRVRMNDLGYAPPDEEFDAWCYDREPCELFEWLIDKPDEELEKLSQDLYEDYVESAFDTGDE